MRLGVLMTTVLFLNLIGCASYEYDVVTPAEMARHVGKDEQRFDRDRLVYWAQTRDNRLVLRIENAGPEPVRLLGEDSWLVTPDGQSRGMVTQNIAPTSYVELILPPPPGRDRSGPRVGFGLGVGSGFGGGPFLGSGVGVGTEALPRNPTWPWPPDQSVRLRLTFHRAGTPITHDWTFTRRKL